MRTRTLVVVCCLAAFAGGCSKTLDSTGVESQVKAAIEDRLGQTGMTVDCPDDVEVRRAPRSRARPRVRRGPLPRSK
jgi:hypothetical protein